jgi:putative ABC transport system permease protein
MIGFLRIACRYAWWHRGRTMLLVAALALVFTIPAALAVLSFVVEEQLSARARATPLVIGAKGSPLELTLHALYFRTQPPAPLPYAEVTKLQATGLGLAIPITARHKTGEDALVATTRDYFDFRRLTLQSGSHWRRLGDCVAGASVARKRNLKPGDTIVSRLENALDVAGARPLRMRITGVLSPTGTPDDDVFFIDSKTGWVIDGIGHGHDDLTPNANSNHVVAGKPITPYTEITDANVSSFHFHGDPGTFPVHALLAVPPDEKSLARLLGRYRADGTALQILEPPAIMAELLETVVTVRLYALLIFLFLGLLAMGLAALVFALAWQLRQPERETLMLLGVSRFRIVLLMGADAVFVLFLALIVAGLSTFLLSQAGGPVLQRLIIP